MTGYGRNGQQENSAAYDVNILATCGLMEATEPALEKVAPRAPVHRY